MSQLLPFEEDFPGAEYKGATDAQGRRSGQGIMRYPDGSQYSGGWSMGLKHGFGALTEADGRRIEGDFSHGFLNGECQEVKKRWCCRQRKVKYLYGREDHLL